MSRVLVTGGSGFIGTHLVAALLERGATVSNVDLKGPFLEAQRAHWTQLDILDESALARHATEFRPDIVFNLAAVADISLGGEALRVNTEGLANVLRVGETLSPVPRLVHTSTQMVVKPGYEISGPRDYDPYTSYGESKAAAEEILWNWTGNTVWTIVRPTIVWGPWHQTLATSTWRYLKRRWYMIVGGRDPVRTYSYVRNLVSQLIAAAYADPALADKKMFYGGEEPIRTSSWIDAFSRGLTGKPARRVPYALLSAMAWAGEALGKIGGPSPINRGRLYRMTNNYIAPMAATMDVLGPGPVSLEQGVQETIEWLRREHSAEYGRR